MLELEEYVLNLMNFANRIGEAENKFATILMNFDNRMGEWGRSRPDEL